MTDIDRDNGHVTVAEQGEDKPPKQTLRPPGVPSREEFGKP